MPTFTKQVRPNDLLPECCASEVPAKCRGCLWLVIQEEKRPCATCQIEEEEEE